MSCPQNSFGQPACNIVEHPDNPHESFCATCKRRFQQSEYSNSTNVPVFIAVILGVLLVGAVVSGKPQTHVETLHPMNSAK